MRHLRLRLALMVGMLVLFLVPARAETPADGIYPVDPFSVQRYGPAFRYPQAGWIVLHVEGEPYERGYQHGRLMAPEIAAYLRCSAALQSAKAPSDGWRLARKLVNALFLRRYDAEYLQEMKGIADGAAAAGAKFENRPVDFVDIVALNAWPELDTLDSALEATPTGLEGLRFPHAQPRAMPKPKEMHCSAFAATGPATADGKIVFGHITMFSLIPSLHYNVWIDVKPTKGHRVIMQSYPGGMQSGFDYYMNDAGLLVCETTIDQTRYAIEGEALASRIRKALQYADSIDGAVEILKKGNNGLYTNEWLMADTKTNEIAMFELGTYKTKLYRSNKNEWFGGTEGFYWGCNNAKDLDVRLETIPGVNVRPANAVWRPSNRDQMWLKLFNQHKGKIDVSFGKLAFTTPPIAAYHSLDAKFTTTELAKDLKSWALFGPPLGRTWEPTQQDRERFPEVRPMVSNPWTVLTCNEPPKNGTQVVAVDLGAGLNESRSDRQNQRRRRGGSAQEAAWHGTLLPKSNADIWLVAAFAEYERWVAKKHSLKQNAKGKEFSPEDRDRMAVDLFAYRSNYELGKHAGSDVPLSKTHSDVNQDNWYRVAVGKGVLVLHELHQLMKDDSFEEMMDSFGRAHAGQEVTAAQFQEHVAKATGKDMKAFFDYWTKETGLPFIQLGGQNFSVATAASKGPSYSVGGTVFYHGPDRPLAVQVTLQTEKGEITKKFRATGRSVPFHFESEQKPKRVIVDKYGISAHANGGPYSVHTFHSELERTLIVYGTADEKPTNREAAEIIQKGIITSGPNITVPIKSEIDLTEDDLRTHHLILVGRPDSNRLVERFQSNLPIQFGSRSFEVRNERYAHAQSAVLCAAANPMNRRYSVVVVAGLSAESTRRAAGALLRRGSASGEVVVLPNGKPAHAMILPAPELVQDVDFRAVSKKTEN